MDEDEHVDDLRLMAARLRARVDDLGTIAARLREILQQRSPLSDDEIERTLAEARRTPASAMLEELRARPIGGSLDPKRTQ